MVCVPKSTLSNWMNELARWCPSLRVIRFHGNKDERQALVDQYFNNEAAAHDGKRPNKTIMNEKGELVDDNSDNPRGWDVCVTTYEICNAERKTFQKFAWKYLIIDEAHRLKNDASMFSKTVRSFRTANRLLLTGCVAVVVAVVRYFAHLVVRHFTHQFSAAISYVTELPYKIIFVSCGHSSTFCFRTFSVRPSSLMNGSTWKLTTTKPRRI